MRLKKRALPEILKTDPADFGGGREKPYTAAEIAERMCSKAGCEREGYATWQGCADGNIYRPLCAEHDVELNRIVQEWWGDPDWEGKIIAYATDVQNSVDRWISVPWVRDGD